MPIHRRRLLQKSAALACTLFAGGTKSEAAPSSYCSPDNPLHALTEGNQRFQKAWQAALRDPNNNLGQITHNQRCFNTPSLLNEAQKPWATVLTCADSRVSPSWIFDTTPGELFVIRSAGNTAFTEALASIEYSVSELNTSLVMVMGHTGCGAVQAATSDNPLTPSLAQLVQPIREQIGDITDLELAVRRNACGAAASLLDRSELLRKASTSGAMKLVVSCFDLNSGAVTLIE